MLIGPPGTDLNEILIEFQYFIQDNAFENVVWKKIASICLGLNGLDLFVWFDPLFPMHLFAPKIQAHINT